MDSPSPNCAGGPSPKSARRASRRWHAGELRIAGKIVYKCTLRRKDIFFQTPPDFVVKFQALDIAGVILRLYDDYTSWLKGRSRRERPSPSEALRLPRNPGECGIFSLYC